jgi:hypothetical protein
VSRSHGWLRLFGDGYRTRHDFFIAAAGAAAALSGLIFVAVASVLWQVEQLSKISAGLDAARSGQPAGSTPIAFGLWSK